LIVSSEAAFFDPVAVAAKIKHKSCSTHQGEPLLSSSKPKTGIKRKRALKTFTNLRAAKKKAANALSTNFIQLK
jgi:hypothetical protein